MQTPSSLPHISWSEVWLPLLTFVFGGSVTWVRLWLSRKRPSEIDATNERTKAEARKIDADASAVVAEVVVSLSAKLAEVNNDLDTQRERHVQEIEAARNRTHSAVDEVNRCIGFIKHHELLMTQCKIEFEPFMVKSYKDIMGEE